MDCGIPSNATIAKCISLLSSDNDTVRELYTLQRADDCYLEVYSLCQEGQELIQTTTVHASDEVMFCSPPKRLHTKVLEHMSLSLGIESKPILVLILTSLNTLVLYLLLIPMVVCAYRECIWRVMNVSVVCTFARESDIFT